MDSEFIQGSHIDCDPMFILNQCVSHDELSECRSGRHYVKETRKPTHNALSMTTPLISARQLDKI